MGYNTKRIRHVCSVKGCSNRDTILIAKNGQIGGVYLCKECAKKAYDCFTVKKKVEEVKTEDVKAEEVVEEVKAVRRTMAVPKSGKGDK